MRYQTATLGTNGLIGQCLIIFFLLKEVTLRCQLTVSLIILEIVSLIILEIVSLIILEIVSLIILEIVSFIILEIVSLIILEIVSLIILEIVSLIILEIVSLIILEIVSLIILEIVSLIIFLGTLFSRKLYLKNFNIKNPKLDYFRTGGGTGMGGCCRGAPSPSCGSSATPPASSFTCATTCSPRLQAWTAVSSPT